MSTIEERPQLASSIPQDYTKRLMVFGGRASMELAARIADRLDVELGVADLRTFANGEVYCRYEESIRGADVFLVQSTARNEAQSMTPNDALMELLVMIDAAQGASAHRIIAVMPWYGYARQDKKSSPREPISARVVAKCLEEIGTDRVLTMDLHAGQVQGFFHIPVDHMTAMPMLTQWFMDQAFDEELVIVSPDAGRVKMALALPAWLAPRRARTNPARSRCSTMRAMRAVSASSSSISTERNTGSARVSGAPARICCSTPSTSIFR